MKYVRMGAAVVLAFGLAACGGNTNQGSTDPNAVEGDIVPREISWLTSRPTDSAQIGTMNEIAADYAADHPGFALNLITTPDQAAHLQKYETLATAHQLPEFFDTDATPFTAKLRDQGQMVDVEALLDSIGILDTYRPMALDYQRFDDGGLYMLPLEFEIEVFWYNTKIFEQAGLQTPTTLDDMVSMCGPLRDQGVVPIAVDGMSLWPLERYMAYYPFREAGPDYVTSLKQGKATLADGPGADGAQWVSDLGAAGCFADGFSSAGYTDARDLFTSGQAAVYNIGTWEILTMSSPDIPIADSIDYFTLPTTDGAVTADNEYVVVSGIGMGINSETFDPLVKDFLTFVLKEYPARYAATGRFSPFTGVDVTKPEGATPIFDKALAELDNLGGSLAMPWDTQLDPTSNTRLQQELTLLAQGDTSPQDFVATVDAIIADNAPKFFG